MHKYLPLENPIRSLVCILLLSFLLTDKAFSEAHDILLEDTNGKQHSLNEYIGKGKWVVVNVWATACPYCRAELEDLNNFHARHHNNDAIVIGLTLEWPGFAYPDKDYLVNFALDYFIDYTLFLVDAELASKVIGKQVNMIPITFFYNPEGKLVLRLNGVVTEAVLEEAIKNKSSSYREQWAKEIPPEFKPE
jgi:thiol-disulfide isomerase/thioredoxin